MPMTKSQIAAHLADEVGITKKQSAAYLDSLAALAYKEAKQTFTLPGLGKLVLQAKAARTGIMPFGPKKGEKYKIPARKVVRFRVAKAAKDAILKLKK
jgi:DNA-binding protein HU-beta